MTSSPNFASKRRIHATKNGRLVGYRIVESPNDDEPASTCSPTVTTRLSYETTAESLTSAITSANGEKASTSAATTPSYEKKATTLNEKRKSAVLIFHPMGASAHVVDFFAPTWLKKVDSSHVLLSVDRPGAGDTSWETPPLNNAVGSFAAKAEKRRSSFEDNLKYDFSSGSTTVYGHLVRHAEDCLSVLLAEKVTEVKVIAICLGHAYMTYFLLFLQSQRSRKSPGRQLTEATLMPRVTDVTLLAPFVSAACADTLRQARWASYLPSPVLHVGTSLLGGLQRSVIPIAFGAFGGEFLFRCLFWRKERERFTCSSENSTLSTSTTAAKKLPGPGTVLEAMQLASRRCMGTEMKVGADRGWHRGCEELADVLAESRDESKNSKPSEKKPSPEDEKNSSSISSTCDEQKQSSRWEKKEDWCSASTCCSTPPTPSTSATSTPTTSTLLASTLSASPPTTSTLSASTLSASTLSASTLSASTPTPSTMIPPPSSWRLIYSEEDKICPAKAVLWLAREVYKMPEAHIEQSVIKEASHDALICGGDIDGSVFRQVLEGWGIIRSC